MKLQIYDYEMFPFLVPLLHAKFYDSILGQRKVFSRF